ncbi:MAG TPA: RNA polymerase sigma factor [Bacteroidales bacterium]
MSRQLFETHIMPASEKMYRYALSILNEPETAHDVVQDCLVKIWENRQKLPEIKSLESWAMRITRNQCYDWVKTNRFSVSVHKIAEPGGNQSADQQLLVSDQKQWFEQVLAGFPQKQKEIFHLREVEEMTYQEIADILSLSISDVKVTLHRMREKIRSSLQKIEDYGIAN